MPEPPLFQPIKVINRLHIRSIFLHAALLALLLVASGQQQAGKSGEELLKESQRLYDAAEYNAALDKAMAALLVFRQKGREDVLKTVESLLLMGDVFLEQSDLDGAVQQYEEALVLLGQKPSIPLKAKAYNGLGEYHYRKDDFKQAEIFHRKALVLREKDPGPVSKEAAASRNNLGNCFASLGRYAEALNMHRKTLEIRQQVLPAGDPAFAVSHTNLGTCLYLTGDYAHALEEFETALKIRRAHVGADHPQMASLYNNLGNCYTELGRPDLGLDYYEKSLAIRRQHFSPDHPSIAAVLENLGDLSVGSGDYLVALDYYREAYGIQRSLLGETSLAAASLWHKIGLCHQYKGDYVQALKHHLTAAGMLLIRLDPEHPTLAELYSNIGNCYADKKETGQAAVYYRKSLQIFRKAYPEGHPAIAQACNNLGRVLLEQKDDASALSLFQEAEKELHQFSPSPERDARLAIAIKNGGLARAGLGQWPQALADCKRALGMLQHSDPLTALELLSGQGMLLKKYALLRNDLPMLRTAAGAFGRALGCIDSLRMQMTSSDTRLHWVTRKYEVFSEAVETNFALWEKTGETAFLETAFVITERAKSLQLIEDLRKEEAESFAGIPDSLLTKERGLEMKISVLEKLRSQALQQKDTSSIQQAEAALAMERRNLATLVSDFETHFPDYFRLKYAPHTATPASIRSEFLKDDQALTAYFVADSTVFAFVITHNAFNGVRIPKDFPLTNWVTTLRNSIQGYPVAGNQEADSLSKVYVEVAVQLFEKMVAPLEKAGLSGHPFWTLVPDRELAFLPFEVLLRKMPEVAHRFKSHAYLLRDYSISYAYSATQLGDLLAHPHQKPAKTLAAFAPDFEGNRYGLAPLKHNRREVQGVSAMFDGDVREGAAASVEAFRRDAGQYRMVLLATHGKATNNPENPSYLAFSPVKDTAFRLYIKDLYSMHLPAELVVLSACETNLGEYKAGEGVVSLAKGFFHAGVRSMVATLWSVDDARNADLMTQFFRQIKKGLAKDRALQQAKLDFLKMRPHDEAHPFYWAAAVATGDMAAMSFFSPWRWLGYAGVALVISIFFIFLKKKNLVRVPFQNPGHRKA